MSEEKVVWCFCQTPRTKSDRICDNCINHNICLTKMSRLKISCYSCKKKILSQLAKESGWFIDEGIEKHYPTYFHLCMECMKYDVINTGKYVCDRCGIRGNWANDKWNENMGISYTPQGDMCYECKGLLYYNK